MRARVALTALAAFLAAWTPCAHAGEINVSPVRVELAPGVTVGTLTLQNVGADPVRLQLHAFGWSMRPDGTLNLTPSDDIAVFPTLLTLAPGASRSVRVGYAGASPHAQRTYRVFIDELPSLEARRLGVGLALRARIGVPIFVEAPGTAAQPLIGDVALHGTMARVTVENTGTAAFMADRVALQAVDANGNALGGGEQPGWYVLAGERRVYDFRLPGGSCARVAGVALELRTSEGRTVKTTRPVRCT